MNQLKFLRMLVIFNGAIPLLMLGWDAYWGQLGANAVNNSLHITGILSLVFLFLSLLMTPLRWLTEWAGWIGFRRTLGLYSFFYAFVHLVIYVGLDRAGSLTSTFSEIWTRQFLQVGTIALLLMIPLAVTSTNAMLQRIGSKQWKRLHRLAYVVAALGVTHFYMLVKSDVRQPLAFAAVLTLLLGIRFGRHYLELLNSVQTKNAQRALSTAATAPVLGQRWNGDLKIAAIFEETHDVKTFRLTASDGGPLPFAYLPGQFATIQLSIGGKRVNRSYTLASSPTRRDACEFSIKRDPAGTVSRFVHDQLEVGDVVRMTAPAGKFTFTGHEAPGVVMIAGGVGITPLMSMLRYLTDRAWAGDIYFVIVAKTEQDLIFDDEIAWMQHRFPNLRLRRTLTRVDEDSQWNGERGRLTEEMLQRFVPNLTDFPVYLCGPAEMMVATESLLAQLNVPASHLHTEAFSTRKSANIAVEAAEFSGVNGSAKTKAAREEPQSNDSDGKHSIEFTRSLVQSDVDRETTVLEAAEAASIDLTYECRSGICGQCKTRLVRGEVEMDCEDALSTQEKSSGFILACQARPFSDIVVDA